VEVIKTVLELKSWVSEMKSCNKRISCVPTMGYLHEGHLSLIKRAKEIGDVVVTTIFVNPTQFAPTEDLDKYPKNILRDTKLAEESGADVLFLPEAGEMYPDGFSTSIELGGVTKLFEGEIRPTHFSGVATVVAKLLLLTEADSAVFGQKDYQQTLVVKKLVRELNIPCRIVVAPIVREKDGLAMSSRNVYLEKDDRNLALGISKSLFRTKSLVESGEFHAKSIEQYFRTQLLDAGITEIDYATAVDAENLTTPEYFKKGDTVVLLVVARVGGVRLLDNAILDIP